MLLVCAPRPWARDGLPLKPIHVYQTQECPDCGDELYLDCGSAAPSDRLPQQASSGSKGSAAPSDRSRPTQQASSGRPRPTQQASSDRLPQDGLPVGGGKDGAKGGGKGGSRQGGGKAGRKGKGSRKGSGEGGGEGGGGQERWAQWW